MISCWRIFNPKYTVEQAISGAGSVKTGGRWNSMGIAMVYTSETLSLAAFEILVHLGRENIFNSYRKVEIQIPERLILTATVEDLPPGWDERSIDPYVAMGIGDQWINDNSSLALRVPSAIIPQDNNILINPNHSDWKKIVIMKDSPFVFDHRLKK